MKAKGVFLILATLILSCSTETKTENLKTFSKAYGYVKYFHPCDEAFNTNWQKFSALGAREVIECKTRKELLNTLNSLFNPIAPGVKFILSGDTSGYDIKDLIPDDTAGFRITYWQHLGVNFDIHIPDSRVNVYRSTRVNRRLADTALFSAKPEFRKILKKEIGQGITCYIPQALYCNDESVYPLPNTELALQLKKDLSAFDYNTDEKSMRFGNVIYVYNIFKHFYPYFDVVKVNWDDEFTKALTKTFLDKTPYDHLETLEQFTAALKDGHTRVTYQKTSHFSSPPISWEWIEGKLVITKNYDNNPDFRVGDIITEIDGKSPEGYFDDVYSRISAPTKGWLHYIANSLSLIGEKNSVLSLAVNDKPVELKRDRNFYDYTLKDRNSKLAYRVISDSIWYLNMEKIEMDTITKIMPLLEKSRAIICDARGYPNGNHDFLTHFMNIDDTVSGWMQTPRIIYPDFENVTYEKHNWIPMMKAQKPYLGEKKLIYIIDGRAISYAESCLGYVEGYKLATIVGQPSAGTNGNINPFTLPGGYFVSWTGMKVVKHNGSQHHGVGIKPDIYVEKTIKGITEGRDEFLEKAIEIAGK